MSPETKALLKTSWAMVAPIGDTAATLFYEKLFTLDPSLRRLFKMRHEAAASKVGASFDRRHQRRR